MDKAMLTTVAISTIAVTWMMAETLNHVGEYQLDAVYNCSIKYNEQEHQRWCRNELDGFGSLYDGGQRILNK